MFARLGLISVLLMGLVSPAFAQDGPDPIPTARRFGQAITAAPCSPDTLLCLSGRLSLMDSIIDALTRSSDCEEAPVVSYCTGDAAVLVKDYLGGREAVLMATPAFFKADATRSYEDQIRRALAEAEGPCAFDLIFCAPARISVLAQAARSVADMPCAADAACLSRRTSLAQQVAAASARQLGRIFDMSGWPDLERFGGAADQQTWALLRRAGAHPDLQEQGLNLARRALEKGLTHPADLPFVADQVAVSAKRPQPFGTQGRCEAPGAWRPLAIAEPATVDARRQEAGLQPLEFMVQAESAKCR